MDMALVERLAKEIPQHPELSTVFIGGIGEPLTHPHIIEIIQTMKQLGKRVEMITNGTLLTLEMSKKLIQSGLNMLWVSVDGAFSPCYEDIRQGATASTIYRNLEAFCQAKMDLGIYDVHIYDVDEYLQRETLQLGLAFVAMKRNIKELPQLIAEARKFGVREIKVTHVIPYTEEMVGESLYEQTIRYNLGQKPTPFVMHVDLPIMDWTPERFIMSILLVLIWMSCGCGKKTIALLWRNSRFLCAGMVRFALVWHYCMTARSI